MTLRIAHVDTERTWRGGQQQVLSLMTGLAKKGHTNFAVVRAHSALHQELTRRQIPTFPIRTWGEWDFIAAHHVNRFLKKEKIDVVHAHSGHAVGLAAFSTLGTSIPSVTTRRVDFPLKRNFLSRFKYRRMKKVIAISHAVEQILIASGISADKISIVHSGVDFSRFENVQKLSRKELAVSDDVVLVGQVAALAPHKDQRTFLLALSELKKTRPHVLGLLVGDGSLRNELENLAKELQLQNNVRFLGFRKEPLQILAAFDIFCLTSIEEGLGTSIIDAMALKVPVVATRAGGIPDLIEDSVTGYLAPIKNFKVIAQKIDYALENAAKHGVIDAAFAKARQFDIRHTVEQTEQIYQQVCGK